MSIVSYFLLRFCSQELKKGSTWMGLIAACETSDNCRMRDAVSTVMAHRDGLLGWARKFMAKAVYTSFSKTALLPGFTERAAALGWGTPRRVLASD